MAGGGGLQWASVYASLRRSGTGQDTQACARDMREHVLVRVDRYQVVSPGVYTVTEYIAAIVIEVSFLLYFYH